MGFKGDVISREYGKYGVSVLQLYHTRYTNRSSFGTLL